MEAGDIPLPALGAARDFRHQSAMDRQAFAESFDVPRGTTERLERYADMLRDWQTRMNLVGPTTLDNIWGRHFADSAQLARHVPTGRLWLDMGSGGGFPGLVLAAMDHGRFILVESIAKKARFLEAVRDALGLTDSVTVINGRVEALPTLGVEVATARAAAPLATLFDWAIRHVRPGGLFLFPKGRRWATEVSEAGAQFSFQLETHQSLTDPESQILLARGVRRR